jgi:DNA polymerase III epsilon subunit family exonuclease
MAEKQKCFYLSRHVKSLEDPKIIYDHLKVNYSLLEEKPINVYHHDERISFLAAALVRSILDRPVTVLNDLEVNAVDGIVLELEAAPKPNETIIKIPIYSLAKEKRKGTLSNLYKFLQALSLHQDKKMFDRFIMLDLETTDRDTSSCGIVEIAAVKVENGKVSGEVQTLINPGKPISKAAAAIHHISDADVGSAPKIDDFWPEFKAFIEDNIIIAHNGYNFDFPILDRFARKIEGKKLSNIRFDSLAMARNIFPGKSNSIDSLIERFNLKFETRHRALDDVHVLINIFDILQEIRSEILRRTSFEMFLDIVALGNFIENKITAAEDRLFFIAGARKLLTPYAKIRSKFAQRFEQKEDKLISDLTQRLSQLQPEITNYRNDEHLMFQINSISNQYDQMNCDEAIANFLSYISLHSAQDDLSDVDAISLLTYHAAKGLEFDKVILVGLEEDSMPGFHATRDDIDDDRTVSQKVEEQRRLFYVGITRAKTELILTAVKNRGGWEHQSSTFLKDLDIPYIVASNE